MRGIEGIRSEEEGEPVSFLSTTWMSKEKTSAVAIEWKTYRAWEVISFSDAAVAIGNTGNLNEGECRCVCIHYMREINIPTRRGSVEMAANHGRLLALAMMGVDGWCLSAVKGKILLQLAEIDRRRSLA